MKKVLFLLMGFVSLGLTAQTIVSTQTEKRKVVFEEYTGVNCGYCPKGHQQLGNWANNNPGTVVINIHQGGYAAMYTTQWGDGLAGQASISGYPAFTVSRTVLNNVSACKYANYYSNSDYTERATTIQNQDSPVNIAATAEIDATTGVMNVHVEAYYTADVNQNFNMLQVVLLQDSIEGPQSNYGNYNSSQILPNGNYLHMHMLRDMITGKQWGDTIGLNTNGVIPAGTFVEKDYSYSIPGYISNEEVVWKHLNLAIFVSDGTLDGCSALKAPNIWTGIKTTPSIVNVAGNHAIVTNIEVEEVFGCKDYINLSTKINNTGVSIESLTFEYGNGIDANQTYTFTANNNAIGSFESKTFDLGSISIAGYGSDGKSNTDFTVNILSINGEQVTPSTDNNTSKTETYTKTAPKSGEGEVKVIVKTDQYGSEFSWKILDENGSTVASGGPYADVAKRDTTVLSQLTTDGCYIAVAKDTYGDGMSGGFFRVYAGSDALVNITGSYSEKKMDFVLGSSLGLNESEGIIAQSIVYPNPARDVATLSIDMLNPATADIQVVDMLGREVISLSKNALSSGNNKISINTSSLTNGNYFIRVVTNDGMVSHRLNIAK
ncbi:MAG: Omp28-related outer membrane protein [Bacteroidota bacterium]|nr:Omp28-related outer membrane protein [Bacteroidota bacterium]